MNPIDNNISIKPPLSEADRLSSGATDARQDISGKAAESDSAPAGESVSLTNTAAELLSLETQLRELPGIDQERVDSIRRAISDGSYEIDAGQIVDSLLLSESELT